MIRSLAASLALLAALLLAGLAAAQSGGAPSRAPGPLITPGEPAVTYQTLRADRGTFPRVPDDTEVMIVSGYGAEVAVGDDLPTLNVLVDQPDTDVVLILTTDDPVRWQVLPTETTRLRAIVVSATRRRPETIVTAPVRLPLYERSLEVIASIDSARFILLRRQLGRLGLGEEPRFVLAAEALPPQIPPSSFERLDWFEADEAPVSTDTGLASRFTLLDGRLRPRQWTGRGPAGRADAVPVFPPDLMVKDLRGLLYWQATPTGLRALTPQMRLAEEHPLPANFPPFRALPSLATLGSDLYLTTGRPSSGIYRFDMAGRGGWTAYRDLGAAVDPVTLATDRAGGLVAWLGSQRGIQTLGPDGLPGSVVTYARELPFISVALDRVAVPKFSLIPGDAAGEATALVLFEMEGIDPFNEPQPAPIAFIWLLDPSPADGAAEDALALTYYDPEVPVPPGRRR